MLVLVDRSMFDSYCSTAHDKVLTLTWLLGLNALIGSLFLGVGDRCSTGKGFLTNL